MILQRFFQCKKQSSIPLENPLYKSFMGAGCVFTDGKHVLAGYQPNKRNPCITGIGGHKEKDETYYQTAFRETVEELFHLQKLPPQLLPTLLSELRSRKEQNHKNYIILHYDFEDLKKFLQICKKCGIESPLYKKTPKTLLQLLQERSIVTTAEITHLCLLPVVKDFQGKQLVHPSFIQDMRDM